MNAKQFTLWLLDRMPADGSLSELVYAIMEFGPGYATRGIGAVPPDPERPTLPRNLTTMRGRLAELIENLPDDSTLDDVLFELYGFGAEAGIPGYHSWSFNPDSNPCP